MKKIIDSIKKVHSISYLYNSKEEMDNHLELMKKEKYDILGKIILTIENKWKVHYRKFLD